MIDVHTLAQDGGPASSASGIALGDAHAAGTLTLSDAASRNIPDLDTYRTLGPAFSHWGKAPLTYCVLVRSTLPGTFACGYGPARGQASVAAAREIFREAYAVTWALDCFIKPTVPLIDGAVSGAGVGLSLYGTHRVAGAGYRFSMPGPADGWFPDHGTAHVFSRMPDSLGAYLALTGRAIGRGDAFRLGLLTQCIDSERFAHIARCLSDADPVDPLLDDLHTDDPASDLDPHRETIARCFSAGTIDEILERLLAVTGADAAWAQAVAADLHKMPRNLLDITLQLLGRARSLDLRDTLILDYRIAAHLLAGDLNLPTAAYFAPPEDGDLALRTRAEMQAVT